ncbi:MAG: cytochrome b [Gammaproteobacteria bacterium]|nr:cytochrome b [Gammaproteobacteria bacterium]
MQKDTASQLSKTTVALHWIVGLTMIGLLAAGQAMEMFEIYALYPIHKALGFLIFFVIVARVAWRIKNGWPTPVSQYQRHEQVLSKIVHWALIIGTLLMPISGFLMSALGGYGVDVFGWEVVAMNPDPENPGKVIAHNGEIAGAAHSAHGLIGKIMMGAVALHIAGALKHHVVDKDGTLRRMLGKAV